MPTEPVGSDETLADFYTRKTTDHGEVLVPFHDGPFSQWWPQGFEKNGMRFPTAEHWMMYQKAVLFGDTRVMRMIRSTDSPKEAKSYGRTVRRFNQEAWDRHARRIVFEGNLWKFQEPNLRRILLETGGDTIVEASPHDRIWGVGLSADDGGLLDRQTWRGRNWLGEVLMAVRYALELELL